MGSCTLSCTVALHVAKGARPESPHLVVHHTSPVQVDIGDDGLDLRLCVDSRDTIRQGMSLQ